MTRRRAEVVVALPALVGTVAVLLVARKGAYASADSAFYVGVARNLRETAELVAPPGSQPLAHFPPLFPVVLAAASALLGVDPLAAAEVVNPLLFGATAVLAGLVVRDRTGSARWGAAAAGIVVVSRELLVFGASALSEPLFTALALGSIVALSASITRRSNRLLALAAVLVGLACITRYAGAALIVSGTFALARAERRDGRWRAAAFAAAAATPLLIWVAAVGRTNRRIAFHLFDVEYWGMGVEAVSRWVAPAFLPWPLRLVAVGLAAVAGWHLRRRSSGRRPVAGTAPAANRDSLPLVIGAFAVVYLALLVADRLLLDASGRLDGRFLAPLHVLAVVVVLPLLHRAWTAAPGADRDAGRRALVAGGVAFALLHGGQAVSWAVTGLADDSVGRRGLSAQAWRESRVLEVVAGLPAGAPVYSNAPDAVFLLTGRRTSSLPRHRDLLTGRAERRYPASLEAMAGRLRHLGGVVVYFRPYQFREVFLPGPDEVARAVPLERVDGDAIATLYRAAAGAVTARPGTPAAAEPHHPASRK